MLQYGWSLRTLWQVKDKVTKDHICIFHLNEISRIGTFIETESRLVVSLDSQCKEGERLLMGIALLIGVMKMF